MGRCNTIDCDADSGIVEGYCSDCDMISAVLLRCRDVEFRRRLFRALPLSWRRQWFRRKP